MERYQVILAYDGSHFKGFQRQAKPRTVQGEFEKALHRMGWQGKSILAAGRTDTGAHALGQVVAFDLDWHHTTDELQEALNAYLPGDMVARDVKQAPPSFHPRFDASWRRYLYRIYCQPLREPLLEAYAWRVWPAPDLDVLQQAACMLVGTFDFGAFGTPPQAGGNTTRRVLQAGWKVELPHLVFEITAHAFLYHMVRRLVHMQVIISQEKLSMQQLEHALHSGHSITAQETGSASSSERLVHGLAPAQGLILAEVHYTDEVLRVGEDKQENQNLLAVV